MEYLFFNAPSGFTLQPSLLLAPITGEDDDATIRRKFRLVAGYIDIFIFRRVVNFRTLAYSSIQYTMFNAIRDIRRNSVPELVEILKAKATVLDDDGASEYAPLDGSSRFACISRTRTTYAVFSPA